MIFVLISVKIYSQFLIWKFIVDTPFEGGIFRLTLKLTSEFPHTAPKGYFLTKIFHPNVAANGDIWVNTLKKDWNPAKWSIGHILGVIRCLLIIPFPESSLNEEAGRLFMDDYEEYSRMAKLMTKIHALKWKKIKAEWNENENITSSDYGKKPWKEDNKEKFISNLKFHYKQTSNLDVSMEEEDKTKEPLQNFSNKMNNNLPIDISQNWKYICKQQEADIFENKGRCIENK